MVCKCQIYPSNSCLQSAVRAIALTDITLLALTITFETANVAYVFGILDPFGYLKRDCDPGDPRLNAYCSWTYSIFKKISETKSIGQQETNEVNRYIQISVMVLILLIFGLAIVEGYLFGLLRRGVREEVHHWVKKWFWLRLLILMLMTTVSILKLVRAHYTFVDGLYDLTKLYRVISLLIGRIYMNHLEKTVGVEFTPEKKEEKQGSLGQDIHLLD